MPRSLWNFAGLFTDFSYCQIQDCIEGEADMDKGYLILQNY